jgi:hypothetical protein
MQRRGVKFHQNDGEISHSSGAPVDDHLMPQALKHNNINKNNESDG